MTFLEASIAGKAVPDDIYDWIDRWHNADFSDIPLSLEEYIGFTDDDWDAGVMCKKTISQILESRLSA